LIERDISYGPEARQLLDLYLPENRFFPTLLFVSGGGWQQSSKAWVDEVGQALPQHGIAVALADHRLQPAATVSQQVQDLALAFKWVSEHIGERGGSSGRIFVGGHSAGGHLTALLALDPSYLKQANAHRPDLAGAVLISAVLDTAGRFGPGFSAMEHIQPDQPAALLLYADGDLPALGEQAEVFAANMRALGNQATAVEIDERDHFNILHYFGRPGDAASEAVVNWISDAVQRPASGE
jgi:acetyl esterase/lipase